MDKVNKRIIVWLGAVIVLLVALLIVVWLWRGPLQTTVYQGGVGSLPVTAMSPNFKVAIFGDQGLSENARDVLELVRDEGADMALMQGDLDQDGADPNKPSQWEAMFNDVLGEDYPLFFSQGNHDEPQWHQWQPMLEARVARIPGAACVGDLGVRSACTYNGLFFLLTRSGTDDAYYGSQLAQSDSLWKICSWHKNQRATQVGGKDDEVGWGPYEECRKGGAFIVNGHEHSYVRTKTLSDMDRQTVDLLWSDPNTLRVGAGSSFVTVASLGGRSIRSQERCLPATYPYGCNGEWAKIYTSNQGANYGALFVEFNVDGDERKAHGYFKNIVGEIIDEFTVTADVGGTPAPETEVLVAEGASWKYWDNGTDQGVAWRELSFDDESWSGGLAQLGYGDGDEATMVGYGPDANNKYTTTYFRHTFDVTDVDSVAALSIALMSDDGGVVYLNGEEVVRRNMPAGGISSGTFASRALGGVEENAFERELVSPVLLREGTNVLAVEIHQANLTSSDISFDLTMDVVRQGSGITSAEMSFGEKEFYVRPGDTVEIPFQVTVRGRGIADIIARAVFKIADMTAILSSFNPVFE